MGHRIELTAAAVEDPTLEAQIRDAPTEARAALLVEADQLRAGGDAQRRLAHIVYRALHADIDPSRDADARRAAWFVAELQTLHPAAAPLVRKTAERCSNSDTRLAATLLAARFAEFDGDLAEADRLLRSTVDAVRGTRSQLEFAALFHTARVAANHEDCARALTYSARALTIQAKGVSLLWIGRVQRCRADAFATMRDSARCEKAILAAEAVLPRLSAADASVQRGEIAIARANALLRRGLAERALPWLEQAMDAQSRAASGKTSWALVLSAQAMTDLGRVEDAAVLVARALRSGLRHDVLDFELELVQVRLQRIAGGAASARPLASELLARLATKGRSVVGPDRRARLALELAKLLGDDSADVSGPRRAFDLAATSFVEAISRIDRESASLPELSSFDVDDLVALAEFRGRETRAHLEVQTAVARFFEDAARREGPAFLKALTTRGTGLTACAWCGRIRGTDGRWLPIAHYLPSEDVLDFTHGVCEVCQAPLLHEAAMASEA